LDIAMYLYQIFICNISINNNHSPSNLTNKLQTNALFLTVYLEIEGLWYYLDITEVERLNPPLRQ
jgi:hypothetical protein